MSTALARPNEPSENESRELDFDELRPDRRLPPLLLLLDDGLDDKSGSSPAAFHSTMPAAGQFIRTSIASIAAT